MTSSPVRINRPRAVSFRCVSLKTSLLSYVASCLMLVGCSSEPSAVTLPTVPLHPVKGSVVKADGKPLTEGTVTFMPTKVDAKAATGVLQSDGTFTLKTADSEGAGEGEYRVWIDSPLTEPGAKPGVTRMVVPPAFTEESSTLKLVVKSGTNQLDPIKLVVTKDKAAASRRGAQD